MALIERSATIAAPIAQVYRASQDYAVRYEWDPFPENIHVVSGSPDELQVGTEVLVTSKLGMRMRVAFVVRGLCPNLPALGSLKRWTQAARQRAFATPCAPDQPCCAV